MLSFVFLISGNVFSSSTSVYHLTVTLPSSPSLPLSQTLSSVMQSSREEMEWSLSQMDRGVGISFSSDFNFSLAALLYKGSYKCKCYGVMHGIIVVCFVLWHIYRPSFSGFWHCHSYILQRFNENVFILLSLVFH